MSIEEYYKEATKNEFIYSILNFSPPSKEAGMGAWGFGTRINEHVARKSFETPLSDEGYERMQKIGKLIINGFGFDTSLTEQYHFMRNEEGKLTHLLHFCEVPGNACDLGIEKTDFSRTEVWRDYVPHNVDSMSQASALLCLWLRWADAVKFLASDKK